MKDSLIRSRRSICKYRIHWRSNKKCTRTNMMSTKLRRHSRSNTKSVCIWKMKGYRVLVRRSRLCGMPFWSVGEGRWFLHTYSTPIYVHLLSSECGKSKTLWAFHVRPRNWRERLTYHKGLSTRSLGRVSKGYHFV